MIIDLRYGARLDEAVALLYDETASKVIRQFNHIIGSYSKQHSSNIDWWVSNPASRNTLSSPVFHYLTSIAVVQKLLEQNQPITKIITESKELAQILTSICDKTKGSQAIVEKLKAKKAINKRFHALYALLVGPLRQVIVYLIVKILFFSKRKQLDTPITLIDTFVIPQISEKDHYYPGILDALTENEQKSVFFVPLLYGYRLLNYVSAIKKIRSSKKNYLFKEEFLTLKDYIYAACHYLRLRSIDLNPNYFCGIDVSPLIMEDLKNPLSFESTFIALLNYRFARRLKEANVLLRTVIDWFENQMVDKGWNAGFRKFYSEIKIKGYIGFFPSKYYLCAYPTPEEFESGVLPSQIMVTGHGLLPQAKRFCQKIDVRVAPSLRFNDVWKNRKNFPRSLQTTVLVALPMMKNEAINILNLVCSAIKDVDENIRFWIKPHPTMNVNVFEAMLREYPKTNLEIATGEFNDCIENSNILVSNASSTCIESIAKSVPVILIPNCSGLTENTIPETVDKALWCICHGRNAFIEAIMNFKNISHVDFDAIAKKVKNEFFEPSTPENKRYLLGFA